MSNPKTKWFTDKRRRRNLLTRIALIDLFTIAERPKIDTDNLFGKILPPRTMVELNDAQIQRVSMIPDLLTSIQKSTTFPPKISPYLECYVTFEDKNHIYGIEVLDTNKYDETYSEVHRLGCVVLGSPGTIPIDIYESIVLNPEDIENLKKENLTTTYGRYLANYFCLASVFGDKVEYINDTFKITSVESVIGKKAIAKEISFDEVSKYLDQTFLLGSFSELAVPVYSPKALVTDPNMKKKKDELLKKYANHLDDPVVCAQIENELIQMDKDYLKGDPAMGFFSAASKSFNVARKKQFVSVGMVEEFQKDKGSYTFIKGSLADGWEKEAFPTIANEIRKGSYQRGIETAQGGVRTKELLRTFQNVKITDDDCGSKQGLEILITKDNVKSYHYSNILNSPGSSKYTTLTPENEDQFIGKTCRVRSLMTCNSNPGFCFACAGENYRTTNTRKIGVLVLEFGAALLLSSMKAMHGTKESSIKIENLDDYLI